MKKVLNYIKFNFEDEEYWIEVDHVGYALRQIIVSTNGMIKLSCFEDCLAEGIINESELECQVMTISKKSFDAKWQDLTQEYKKSGALLNQK